MPMPMYSYPGMAGNGMTAWMIISTIFWLILAALAVWALFRLASHAARRANTASPYDQPSATEILKARYARGEIDAATFREMLSHLTITTDEAATPAGRV